MSCHKTITQSTLQIMDIKGLRCSKKLKRKVTVLKYKTDRIRIRPRAAGTHRTKRET